MKFTKMHGLGNDYLYVFSDQDPQNPEQWSIRLSDRHFGAGSDGMIWILPSRIADFKMRIFNADGSEAKMCGNGIRCVGKYVFDKGHTQKTRLTIETLSGIRTLNLHVSQGRVREVTVDMGRAVVSQPLTLTAAGQELTVLPVSVGNPHGVVFVPEAEAVPLTRLGPALEHHPAFPEGVNAEFVQVLGPDRLRMRVWERGSGVTMACGTGACASVAAAVQRGYCQPGTWVAVVLDGGTLKIQVDETGQVIMTGPAETIYEGETAE